MTKTNKETAVIAMIGSSIGGLIVALIMFSFTKDYNSDEFVKEELVKKLDKTEYQIDCEAVNLKLSKKVDNKVFEAYIKAQDKNYEAIIRIDNYIKTLH